MLLTVGQRALIRSKSISCSFLIKCFIVTHYSPFGKQVIPKYSTTRFKLHAREYILASANTFSPSSQPMLVSKGSMLASKGSILTSKGNMLSCMILLAIEVDARVQLLVCIRHHAVSRCTRARLNALVHYFTRDLNLILADITCQAFIKC